MFLNIATTLLYASLLLSIVVAGFAMSPRGWLPNRVLTWMIRSLLILLCFTIGSMGVVLWEVSLITENLYRL